RARLAKEIGKVKGEGLGRSLYDPVREEQVLNRLREWLNTFPEEHLPQNSISAIYREIMSACLSVQAETRVAFLGPLGTYSHLASERVFGRSAIWILCQSIAGVFERVMGGRA